MGLCGPIVIYSTTTEVTSLFLLTLPGEHKKTRQQSTLILNLPVLVPQVALC